MSTEPADNRARVSEGLSAKRSQLQCNCFRFAHEHGGNTTAQQPATPWLTFFGPNAPIGITAAALAFSRGPVEVRP